MYRFEVKITSLYPVVIHNYKIPQLTNNNIKDNNKILETIMSKYSVSAQNHISLNVTLSINENTFSFTKKYLENIRKIKVLYTKEKSLHSFYSLKFTQLECLDIQGSESDDHWNYEIMILNNAQNLKTLKLSNINLSGITIMKQLPQLHTLELCKINAKTAMVILTASKTTIERLKIKLWYNMQEIQPSVRTNAYKIPNLSSLTIDGELDHYMGFINNNSSHISHLSLINTSALTVDLPEFDNLKHLHLENCGFSLHNFSHITNLCLINTSVLTVNLPEFENLKYLHLQNCGFDLHYNLINRYIFCFNTNIWLRIIH